LYVVPAGWNGALYQPSAVDLGGFFEASGGSIAAGGSLSGFSVLFAYTGTAPLGSQHFEIYDSNFIVLDSGQTTPAGTIQVPEPGSLILLASGLAGLGMAGRRLKKA
jgi:hypothetical protein